MDQKRENHILYHIQKLFPRQKVTDAIEIFLVQRIKTHSSKLNWVELGNHITVNGIVINPNRQIKDYTGREICQKIVCYFNTEYWLIVLWDILYEDSKGSSISREIVRAFIKHCISTVAQDLVSFGPQILTHEYINGDCLPNQTKFYQTIFSYNDIIHEMRSRTKKRMRKYTMTNAKIPTNINFNIDKLIKLFDENFQGKYSELIRTIQHEKSPEDQRYAINFLACIHNLTSRFLPHKSQITKKIKKLSAVTE